MLGVIFATELALVVGLVVQLLRRRRAEEQQRISDERYRSVVETQSDLICRFLPDSTLTFVNDAYCRTWGKTRDELLGTKFIELIPEAERGRVLDRIRQIHAGVDSHEHPVTLPDGTIGWHHWINQAIVDERGTMVELQGVGRDITARWRAEEAVRQLEAHTAAMLRAIPDLMFVFTPDGTYVDYHARDESLLLVPPAQFLGRKISDVMPAPLADRFMEALRHVDGTAEPVVVDYELQLSELHAFEARIVSAGEGRMLSIVRDVTDAKRAVARIRDLAGRLILGQESERQRIARELHDDLSQKVAMLGIGVDRLAARFPAAGEAFGELTEQVRDIAMAIHNLSHELHPSKLHMLGLAAALQSLCRDVSRQSGVSVSFTSVSVPEPIDPGVALCLYRVAQEALHNVARHSRSREALVHLSFADDHLYLHIADGGIGFDATAPQEGLGLISMRERVSLVGGELVLHAFPDGGTRIGVRVPIAAFAAAALRDARSA